MVIELSKYMLIRSNIAELVVIYFITWVLLDRGFVGLARHGWGLAVIN